MQSTMLSSAWFVHREHDHVKCGTFASPVLHDYEPWPWPLQSDFFKIGMQLEDSLRDEVSAFICWPHAFEKKR